MRIPRRKPIYPFGDNDALYFGTSNDVGMYWDGTNLVFNPVSGQTLTVAFSAGGNKIYGGVATNSDLHLYANTTDTYAFIRIDGNGAIRLYPHGTAAVRIQHGGTISFDCSYAANVSTLEGGAVAGDDLKLKANSTDVYSYILLAGADDIHIVSQTAQDILFRAGALEHHRMTHGALHMLETATPTAVADFGALYTKDDNRLYFQDGAGVEHEVTIS